MDDKKELEVVSGDGSGLDISPVYDHLSAVTPKSASQKPKNIVIPKEKKKEKKDDKDNKKEEN